MNQGDAAGPEALRRTVGGLAGDEVGEVTLDPEEAVNPGVDGAGEATSTEG